MFRSAAAWLTPGHRAGLAPSLVLGLWSLPLQAAAVDFDALWKSGQRAAAIQAQASELERRPGDAALRRSLVERELEVHWYQQALDHAAGLDATAGPLRGRLLFFLHRFEESLELLGQSDFEQLQMRQAAFERLGRQEEADRTVEQMAQVAGAEHPAVRVLRGAKEARAGNFAAAILEYQAVLAKDPFHGQALYGLGRAQVESGEQEQGLKNLEAHRELVKKLDQLDFARRGVDLAPLHAPNVAQLAEAERNLGRKDRAREHFEQAQSLAVDEQITPVALRHARLLAEEFKDVDAAVLVLEKAAARRPDAALFVRSGDLLLAAGRGIDAVQRFYRAREMRPEDKQIASRIEAARAQYTKGGEKQ